MAGLLCFLLENRLAAYRYTLDRLLAIHHDLNEVVAVLHQAAVRGVQVPTDLVLTSEYRSIKAVHALTQNVEYVDGSVCRSLSCESDRDRTVCRVGVYRQTRNGGLVYTDRSTASVTLVASIPAKTQYGTVGRRNYDLTVDVTRTVVIATAVCSDRTSGICAFVCAPVAVYKLVVRGATNSGRGEGHRDRPYAVALVGHCRTGIRGRPIGHRQSTVRSSCRGKVAAYTESVCCHCITSCNVIGYVYLKRNVHLAIGHH